MELIKNFRRYKIDLDSVELIIWDNRIRCEQQAVIESQIGEVTRGGARNFGLGGPSCDVNILFKTNLYTHI